MRFRVPEGTTVVDDLIRGSVAFDNSIIEDFVILRGNGSPLFLLANVVDDIAQRISHVVRGEEHFPNTPKQQMLWTALGVEPPVWAHVPVLVNEQRKKLSKRRDKVAFEQYAGRGLRHARHAQLPDDVGLGAGGRHRDRPVGTHRGRVPDRGRRVVAGVLRSQEAGPFNGEYVRAMSVEDFIHESQPWLDAWLADHPEARFDEQVFVAMAELVQTRVVVLGEVPSLVDFLFLPDPERDEASWEKAMKDPARELLARFVEVAATVEWTAEPIKDALVAVGEEFGLKLGKAQAPVRVAVTGRTVGPPLFEALELLGREECVRRSEAALKDLGGA
ncbi:MAG: glutamate--tRNA ligase family protein [Ilumatobacteraceae bacterium]